MSAIILSFLASLVVALLLVRYSHLHAHITGDLDTTGIQKFHTIAVPRVGGVALVFGLLVALSVRMFENTDVALFGLVLLACSSPAFLMGFLEDITKRIGVKTRLAATSIAALLAGYFLNAWIQELQVPGIDAFMLRYAWVGFVLTCFAVTGVANAFNLIDGYNGLSGMVGVIILMGITYVSFHVGDHAVMIASLAMIGAILGFFVWNYPRGLIFLGDGGAYLIGFWIAELSILLTSRNHAVSKWFPLLLCFYPIFETLFTIYRRLIIARSHPGMPDAAHLHQIIYKRVVRWAVGSSEPSDKLMRNALTAPYLWVLSSLAVIPAVLYWNNPLLLQFFTILFGCIYIFIYRRLVNFKAPKWLMLKSGR